MRSLQPAYVIETQNNSTINGILAPLVSNLGDLIDLEQVEQGALFSINRQVVEAEIIYNSAVIQDQYTSSIQSEISAITIYNSTFSQLRNLETQYKYGIQTGGAASTTTLARSTTTLYRPNTSPYIVAQSQGGPSYTPYSPSYNMPSTPLRIDPAIDLLITQHSSLLGIVDVYGRIAWDATQTREQLGKSVPDLEDTTWAQILAAHDSTINSFMVQDQKLLLDIERSDNRITALSSSTLYFQTQVSTTYSLMSIGARYNSSSAIYNSSIKGLLNNIYDAEVSLGAVEQSYNRYNDISGNYYTELDSINQTIETLTNTYSSMILGAQAGGAAGDSQVGGGVDPNLMLQSSFIKNLIALNTDLATFERTSNNTNAELSTFYHNELTSYINTLAVISANIMVEIADKVITAFNDQITYGPCTISSLNADIAIFKSYSPALTELINVCQSELLYKDYYLLYKSIYELQSKYMLTPTDSDKLLNGVDFDSVMTGYDLSVQEVNKYMAQRMSMCSTISKSLLENADIFSPEAATELFQETPKSVMIMNFYLDSTGNIALSMQPSTIFFSPPVPIYMASSSPLPPRKVIFVESGYIEPTIPTCVVGESLYGYDIKFMSTISRNFTTTTQAFDNVGTLGRYVRVDNTRQNFLVAQIVVIDRSGRNVALGQNGYVTSLMSTGTMQGGAVTTTAEISTTFGTNTPVNITSPFRFYSSSPASVDAGTLYFNTDTYKYGIGVTPLGTNTNTIPVDVSMTTIGSTTTGASRSAVVPLNEPTIYDPSVVYSNGAVVAFTDGLAYACFNSRQPLPPPNISTSNWTPIGTWDMPTAAQPTTTLITPISNITPISSFTDGFIVADISPSLRAYAPPVSTGGRTQLNRGSSLIIDIGSTYELMAIQIFQQAASPITTDGIVVSVLDTNFIATSLNYLPDEANAQTNIDLRDLAQITEKNIANYPSYIIPDQKGACGIMTRYVRIMAPVNPPVGFYFHISQIAVIGNNGQNFALNKMPVAVGTAAASSTSSRATSSTSSRPASSTTIFPSGAPLTAITDGHYYARPEARCYLGTPAYIEIDLGSVLDVTAVHIYNKSDLPDRYQSNLIVSLLTQERLYAQQARVNTNLNREIIDFRNSDADAQCPIQLTWPSTYGDIGLICQYVMLQGCTGITRLEIVDKMGVDVGLTATITGDVANAAILGMLGNTTPYTGTWCIFDTTTLKELCAIRTYGAAVAPTAVITFSVLPLAAFGGNQPVYSSPFTGMIDLRVDPEGSTHSTLVTTSVVQYGPLGVFAQKFYTLPPTTFTLVDATGKGFGPYTGSQDMGRFYEITAIITGLPNCQLTLSDCNDIILLKGLSDSTGLAKFTAGGLSPALAALVPRAPYNVRYGYMSPSSASASASASASTTLVPSITTTLATTPQTGVGVYARYIKITPPLTTAPLKISQVVAVDASGINVAFEKDVYFIGGTTSSSAAPQNPSIIVNGKFQQGLDTATTIVSYLSYIIQPDATAYISPIGGQYLIIDLLQEYAINSVIYIATSSTDQSGNIGAIVQLYDRLEQPVGISVVRPILRLYNMDIMDFRRDISAKVSDPNDFTTRIEVRERITELGPVGCGIMAMYVRIVQTLSDPATNQPLAVELSQVILRDPTGTNVAAFKPTYAYNKQPNSQRIVDGDYYMRTAATGFVCSNYVEINLQQEYELVSVIVASLVTSSPTTLRGMRVYIYNKYRDVIAVQNVTYTNSALTLNIDTSNFTILNTLIGVQGRGPIVSALVATGLQAALAADINDIISRAPTNVAAMTYARCTAINNGPQYLLDTRGNISNVTYIRIFNQNQYVQISQLMVYDGDGNNVAFHSPTQATDTLSGRYSDYATDGYGGFFHTPRPEANCYVSDIRRYDMFQVRLTGAPCSVSAVRYIPPPTNQYRAIGMQLQLLDGGQNILRQYIFGPSDIGERLLDFRGLAYRDTPIEQLIMPKIYTLSF
jgi:hypothetical protein